MKNSNVVEKEYIVDADVETNNYDAGVQNLTQEMEDKFTQIKDLILNPVNDNSGFDPNTPNSYRLPKDLFKEWKNIEAKIKACDKLIQEKGLSKEEQEARFQVAFKTAENYLHNELELSNLLNQLPTVSGTRTDLETEDKSQYTKSNYIKYKLGLSSTTAWRIGQLTAENVEKAIEYAKSNHEIPTRRLVILIKRILLKCMRLSKKKKSIKGLFKKHGNLLLFLTKYKKE